MKIAWLTSFLHLLGLIVAYFWILPGTPYSPLDARMQFLQSSIAGWRFAWLNWVFCSLTFFLFVWRAKRASRLVLPIAVLAVIVDLACDWLYVVDLPAQTTPAGFLLIEKFARYGGICVANLFYSVVVLLLSLELKNKDARMVGMATFGAGMLMIVFEVTTMIWWQGLSTVAMAIFFSTWAPLAARENQ